MKFDTRNFLGDQFSLISDINRLIKYFLLTEFEVRTVSYGPSFFPVRLWPKREVCEP